MRIGYDELGHHRMYPENENEFGIMNNIHKEVFGNVLINDYEYFSETGIVLAHSHETKLIKIIEKMKNDKIERLLQIRHDDEYVRLAARVMLELWG